MKIFWSWQSDTPGRTGRHFIRQALSEAIETLKQAPDIQEPHERDRLVALHLDHDRQGVLGSPSLFETILGKIEESEVFVGDITPVSIIPARIVDGAENLEKRNMNPNVAIELGYALKSLSDRNILMVMNGYYGDRKFLPFDLAHKAGPIIFSLSPEADQAAIRSGSASLRGAFISALRPYLSQAARPRALEGAFNAAESLAAVLKTGEDIIQRQRKVAAGDTDPSVGVFNTEGELWRESVSRHIRDRHPNNQRILQELEELLDINKHIFNDKYNRAQGTQAGRMNSYLNHSYKIQTFLKKYG